MPTTIKQVLAREILDSRGNPTVEAELILENNLRFLSSVPSGASTGTHEAVELRDNDSNRFLGMGVTKAVQNINQTLGPALISKNPKNQNELDKMFLSLDGTPHKSKLGANAILALSQTIAKAGAAVSNLPLYQYFGELIGNSGPYFIPTPMFNVINGAKHADNNLQIQEFMIVPTGQDPYKEKLRRGTEVFHLLKKTLKNRGLNTAIGDEGGFSPNLPTDEDALQLIVETAQIDIALDLAGIVPEGFDFEQIIQKYPIIALEDPAEEDNFDEWQVINAKFGQKIMIVGDDVFVTSPDRLKIGIEKKLANAILIKPNQIGTITETIEVCQMARGANFKIVASHRSGETEDTLISDLAVGLGCEYLKTGAPSRGERVAKYNRLLRIEEQLALSS